VAYKLSVSACSWNSRRSGWHWEISRHGQLSILFRYVLALPRLENFALQLSYSFWCSRIAFWRRTTTN